MFYNEHNPPHFHAEYQGQRGIFDFNGNLIDGKIRSKTARKIIKKWALIHKKELESNWNNINNGEELIRIAPLD